MPSKDTKKQPDTLLIMAVAVISFAVLYVAWCWAAKIKYGIEPPEGTSLTAIAVVVAQIPAGALIQVFKKKAKSDDANKLADENKELARKLADAEKKLAKAQKAMS